MIRLWPESSGQNRWFRRRTMRCQGGQDYLHRWTLLKTPWFGVFLHRFVRSDVFIYHDHPWSFVSLVLLGGYDEHRPDRPPQIRRAGSLVVRRAKDLHYVTLRRNPTWTLILRGPRRRVWGFQSTPDRWVPWKEYIRR